MQQKLWTSQSQLQHLDIFPSNTWGLRANLDQRYSAINLTPDSPGDAALAHTVLQNKCVTELKVDGCHWNWVSAFAPTTVPDGTIQDVLTKILFSSVPRVARSLPGHFDQLTALCFKDIDLTLSKHTWFTYINLQKLTTLELCYCKGADIFLIHVYDTAYNPKLQSFSLFHDLSVQSDQTVHAVNELLRDTRDSLHTLVLCLRNAHQLPDVTLIGRKSLRVLSLDISRSEDHSSNDEQAPQTSIHLMYSPEDFEVLVASCEDITQLAITFPMISLEYKKLHEGYPTFAMYIERLAKSLELTTLSITNIPPSYDTKLRLGQIAAEDALLERLATDIFEIFTFLNHRDFGSVEYEEGGREFDAEIDFD